LQIQAEAAPLPAGAVESAVHAEHELSEVAPLASEYFPASQSVHVVCAELGLYLPAGQLKQLDEVSV